MNSQKIRIRLKAVGDEYRGTITNNNGYAEVGERPVEERLRVGIAVRRSSRQQVSGRRLGRAL